MRGFDLSDDEASQCFASGTHAVNLHGPKRELLEKVQNARRYGREPFGGLLGRSLQSLTYAYARSDYWQLCLLTCEANGCIDDESRHHARAPGPCVSPLFAGVHIDPREPSRRRRPQALGVLEDTMSKHKGELVSVKIIPNEQGNPPGKLADAEVIFEAEAGPLSGTEADRLRSLGTSRWREKRDVSGPAVLRERGTPELRAAAPLQRGAQRAGGDSGSASSTRTAASEAHA